MDRHDVGIVEGRCGPGFAAEPLLVVSVLGEVRQQHLQCDGAIDGGVVGTPHLAHAAMAQQLHQLVAAKRRALHRLTINRQPLRIRQELGTRPSMRRSYCRAIARLNRSSGVIKWSWLSSPMSS